jgi:hypothetical protein
MKPVRPVVVALLAVLVVAVGVGADERVKHSGSIVSIAPDAKTFVLAELGPWSVRDGVTALTYHTIAVLPETAFVLVTRAPTASGLEGDFIEVPIAADEFYMGDYVTVECRHEGTRMFALQVLVTDPR